MDGVTVNQEGFSSTDQVVQRLREAIRTSNGVNAQPAAPVHAPSVPHQQLVEPVRSVSMAERKPSVTRSLKTYALTFAFLTAVGMATVWNGNRAYGPEMYGYGGMVPAAEASSKNLNYAVFDLNLNIRALREAQIKRMPKAHDVVLLGASHWQEGDAATIAPGLDFFNSHIHRDYWEDLLGMVNLYVKYDRLPKKFIISLRDNQFKPVPKRTDFLWEPGIASYHEMTERLGIERQSFWKTLPYDRVRALLSLPMLFENMTRWHNAPEHPGPTTEKHFKTLDTLLPDGSIVWSDKHMALFTQERALAESMAFVEKRRNDPPVVDQQGVDAFEKVLVFLKEKGVEVTFVKPPFNPVYYDAVQEGTYAKGLKKIEKLIDDLATRNGIKVIGSYNPHDIGCTKEMYIDAEHSNSTCLKKVIAPFVAEQTTKTSAL